LRIRILKRPLSADVDGYNVRHFEVGEVYDVGPCLADLLVIGGYGLVEMRHSDRRSDHRPKQNDSNT
jgi:hypothetical protein